jgi:hypothetical protein
MAAVTELVDRLGMIQLLDAAIGPIKSRDRGFTGGQVLVGLACAQLVGEDFLVGLDRYRADVAGQVLAAVPGLSSTTAAGVARRFTDGQWRAVETAVGDVHTAMLALLPAQRAAALCEQVTIDLDTTDVEVYGRHKRGVAFKPPGTALRPSARGHLGRDRDRAGRGPDGRQRRPATTRGRTPRSCWVARWPRCPPRPGPGGSGCAPTPVTTPGSWPVRRCWRRWSSPWGRAGSRRCGGSSTASPRPTGPTRST